jgi:ABC-2 type transport system permease protein
MILILAGKDWRLFWSDRRAAVLAFLVPILLASVFGIIFDRPTRDRSRVRLPILVAFESDDASARATLEGLSANEHLELEFVAIAELDGRLADREPGVGVIIPANIDALEDRPRLVIRHHPLRSLEARWAEGAIAEGLMKRLATTRLGIPADRLVECPYRIETAVAAGPHREFNSYSHSFCGMTIQYLLFWGMESGLLLLRERRSGVWMRLRTAPVPFSAILLGRALATALIAFLQVLATFAFGYLAFGVTVGGSGFGFLAAAMLISLLAAGFGLVVAAVGGTESRARSLSILAILGISLLGGLWLPSFVLPEWIRMVSVGLPTTWAMRALDATTWQGSSFAAVLPSLFALSAFSLALLGLAFWWLKRSDRHSRGGTSGARSSQSNDEAFHL